MITHQRDLLVPTARVDEPALPDKARERDKLRRELLRRILDREVRRQATRITRS